MKTPATTKVMTSAAYKRNFIGIDRRHHPRAVQRSGTMSAGASHTKSEAADLPVREAFSRPKFKVLDVGSAYPQGRRQCFGTVTTPHIHPIALVRHGMVFVTPEGAKTMTAVQLASRSAVPASPHLDPIALHGEAVNAASMARWYAARHDYAAAFRRSAQATGALRKLAALERVEIAA